MRLQTTHLRKSVIYARRSAIAAKQSADNDDRTVKITQRADVLLESVEVGSESGSLDKSSQFILHFRNFGNTRANDLKFDFWMIIQGVTKVVMARNIPIVLGAGDSALVMFKKLGDLVKDSVIKDIVDGKIKIAVSGTITYKDVFDIPHIVTCGTTFNHKTLGFDAEETKTD
jgi:hypothetical protein